ncbi:radical SAM protein [Candidatus Woesearchaeota archaeon]|jgi:radical SAM protein with 4Fe4S-binding SPASM domain|nr:radical SAM protein [Candidatus Woesearchaeota archaeon]MBT4368217.1 radical SAM protein [Candidatus Woesearchaeota archaeon]MBT4712706.1 radical SAM protein [Candidatus Woesearchaeota archaeon]MBT6639618.1 radical SAM protein [Candidatus Woesearchaeota archaeon]MBT7133790.1 radical SAM protein [Candidatus Woesearchaeota archaeon]
MKKTNWSVGWGLTNACNLSCLHCYNSSAKKSIDEINTSEAKKVINWLSELNVRSLNYGTGECGLKKDFWEIVKYAHLKGIKQGITTNGWSVNKETISLVKKYMNDVDVSLDFPNKKKHNWFRGSNTAWDDAIDALDLLKQYKIPFSIVICFTSKNTTKRILDGFLTLSKKYNCNLRINLFRPTGRGATNKSLSLTPKKAHQAFRYLLERSNLIAVPDPYLAALLNIKADGCPCGKRSFRITPKKTIVPCVYLTKNTIQDPIIAGHEKDLANTKSFIEFNNRKLDFCTDCEHYTICKGGCASRAYFKSKTFDAPDSLCYKLAKIKKNPLADINIKKIPKKKLVHEDYLCTLIIKAK